jgi:hypothetical protein
MSGIALELVFSYLEQKNILFLRLGIIADYSIKYFVQEKFLLSDVQVKLFFI